MLPFFSNKIDALANSVIRGQSKNRTDVPISIIKESLRSVLFIKFASKHRKRLDKKNIIKELQKGVISK